MHWSKSNVRKKCQKNLKSRGSTTHWCRGGEGVGIWVGGVGGSQGEGALEHRTLPPLSSHQGVGNSQRGVSSQDLFGFMEALLKYVHRYGNIVNVHVCFGAKKKFNKKFAQIDQEEETDPEEKKFTLQIQLDSPAEGGGSRVEEDCQFSVLMAALAGTGPCPPPPPPPSTATGADSSGTTTAELKAEIPNMVMDRLAGDKEDTGEGKVRTHEVENDALLIKVDLPDGRPATGKLRCVFFYRSSVLPIRLVADPGCLSRIRRIQGQKDSGSGFASKKFLSIFNPKIFFFLSSRKYDPGCSSRIRILIFFKPIPDIGFRRQHKAPDPDPQHCLLDVFPDPHLGKMLDSDPRPY